MSEIEIKQGSLKRKVTNFSKPFIIAEIGVNHNGSLKVAKKLIDISKKVGADAVKFQTFSSELLVLADTKKARYQEKNTLKKENQLEMLKGLELSINQLKELQKYTVNKGLFFSTTPYSFEDIDKIKMLNLPFVKAASIHCSEPIFLEQLSKLEIPVILSTGLSDMSSVLTASKILKKRLNNRYVILQCTTNYPVSLQEANINVLDTFRKANFTVGFSDHTENNIASLLALSKGACVFEKHITLDKKHLGPDHYASLDEKEFKNYVDSLKMGHMALGIKEKKLTDSEKVNFSQMKRSMYLNKDLLKGHQLKLEDINFMRPYKKASEIKDINKFLGKKINLDVKKFTLLTTKLINVNDQT
jgi:N,N'-diacetyllegionaminate synthase